MAKQKSPNLEAYLQRKMLRKIVKVDTIQTIIQTEN